MGISESQNHLSYRGAIQYFTLFLPILVHFRIVLFVRSFIVGVNDVDFSANGKSS
jgi:uncharacterized membrane protein